MTKRLVGEPRRLVGAEGPPRSMCCGGTVLCCIGSAFSFPCRGPWLLGHASAVTHPPSLIRRDGRWSKQRGRRSICGSVDLV